VTGTTAQRLLDALTEHLLTEPDVLRVSEEDDGSLRIAGSAHEWSAECVPLAGRVRFFLLRPLPVLIGLRAPSTLLAVPPEGKAAVLSDEADLADLLSARGAELPAETMAALSAYLRPDAGRS
jgi:hypothetical protein